MSDEKDEENIDKDNISEMKDSSELVEEQEEQEEELSYEDLKEENKILSDKMMRALAETENIRKKFRQIAATKYQQGCTDAEEVL